MSQENTTNRQTRQIASGGKKKIWLAGLALLIALAIAGAYWAWQSQKTTAPTIKPTVIERQSDDGWPSEFYSYSGEIEKIEENKITIKALASDNYLAEDKLIEVLTDEQTKFGQVVLPKIIEGLDESGQENFLARKEITISELAVGDQITAIAYENVRGKTSFLAGQIELMVVE